MGPHATAGNPLAPPQPMSTMLKVKVAITKLSNVSIILHICICNDDDRRNCYPRKPKGVAFAYLPAFSLACGTFGARYSFSNISGLRLMLVVAWWSPGVLESLAMRSEAESRTMGSVVVVAILNLPALFFVTRVRAVDWISSWAYIILKVHR
jgi:hypothetical protein